MKNIAKLVRIITLVMIIGLFMTTCDLDKLTETKVIFDNQSSHDVTVSCSDLDPSNFTVNAGASKTVTGSAGTIFIQYTPANLVNVSTGTNKFTFTDK